jgi:VWFA-related protein
MKASVIFGGILALGALVSGQSQSSETKLKTPLKDFKIETGAQFLGTSEKGTVVRIRVSSPEIAQALYDRGIARYSLTLKGEIRDSSKKAVQTFSYPVSGEVGGGSPVSFTFLRALPPAAYEVELDLSEGGRIYGRATFPLEVPSVGSEFRPEMAPADLSTLPSAEAVILAAPKEEAEHEGEVAATPHVKIVPPERETPIGLMRLEAVIFPPVEKVEFYLDEKLLVARTRPPYTVEIDLGKVPRRQTVKAIGYDRSGKIVDEDAWAINEGDAKVAVRILPIPAREGSSGVTVRLAVQSINGGVAQKVDLFLDDKKIATFTRPPYETVIRPADYEKASYLRATAVTGEGLEANDLRFLKGGGSTFENVKVDVVQLHVSALDKEGRFVPGLNQADFTVSEDGKPQKLLSFEVAKNLPLNIGLVIDASGSMRTSMNFVHEAGSLLFKDLIHEKDRGFVIKFSEVPQLSCPPTSNTEKLSSAVYAVEASGQTALYDSLVLGLYQFRATSGRKALVVISDGGDNHSWVDYETALRYTRSSGVPVFVIGVNIGLTDFSIRSKLKELAADTGGEIFLTTSPSKISEIVNLIETELRSQYVFSYRTDSTRPEGQFREVKVAVDRPDVRLRTMRGYVP